MKHMNNLGLSSDTQQTYGFVTMYPSLDLKCMKKKLSEYVSLVLEHARQNVRPFNEPKVLVLKRKCANQNPWRGEGSTAASSTPSQQVVTAHRLEKWLRHLLANLHCCSLSLGDPESDGPSVDYLDLTVW